MIGRYLASISVVHFPPVRPQFQRRIFSEASGLILIKFNVNHHLVGGLVALGFQADCIKIVVSMATDRLTMGKTKSLL